MLFLSLLRSPSCLFFITSLHFSFGLPIFRCPHTSMFSVLHRRQSFSPHGLTISVSFLLFSYFCLPHLSLFLFLHSWSSSISPFSFQFFLASLCHLPPTVSIIVCSHFSLPCLDRSSIFCVFPVCYIHFVFAFIVPPSYHSSAPSITSSATHLDDVHVVPFLS